MDEVTVRSRLVALLDELDLPPALVADYVDVVVGGAEPKHPDALVAEGLGERVADDFVVVPPRYAVAARAAARRAELQSRDRSLETAVQVAANLQRELEVVTERAEDAGLVEVLYGPHAAAGAVGALVDSVERSLYAWQPGPTIATRHEVPQRDLAALRRGAVLRGTYGPEFLEEEGALEMIRALSESGEEVRVHSSLPTPMLLVDDRVTVLPPHRDGHPAMGALIVRSSSVTAMATAVYELLWRQSRQLDVVTGDSSPDEGLLEEMLLTGFTDQRIARELDISIRTLRRRIAVLMDEYGARTRTQLGALLAAGPHDGS